MAKKKRDTVAAPSVDRDWRARDDLNTLRNAAEIGKDRPRLKAAQAEAKKQMAALRDIGGMSGGKKSREKRLDGKSI